MEASITSALAALSGTAIGGLTTVAANWLNYRNQIRAQWLQHEKNRRQILYRDFIDEASKCYIDALQHNEAVPKTLPEKSSIPIWSRTRALSNCATWRSMAQSTYCANSATHAATNLRRCGLSSFESRR